MRNVTVGDWRNWRLGLGFVEDCGEFDAWLKEKGRDRNDDVMKPVWFGLIERARFGVFLNECK